MILFSTSRVARMMGMNSAAPGLNFHVFILQRKFSEWILTVFLWLSSQWQLMHISVNCSFTDFLLCAKQCSQCLIYITLFNLNSQQLHEVGNLLSQQRGAFLTNYPILPPVGLMQERKCSIKNAWLDHLHCYLRAKEIHIWKQVLNIFYVWLHGI
jgi:hypothetical protein